MIIYYNDYKEVKIVNFYSEKCDLVANIRCCKTRSAREVQEICLKITQLWI